MAGIGTKWANTPFTGSLRGVNELQITEVRVRRITGDNRVRALASITIDDAFAVHDLRVIDGEKGLFVSMPSRRRVSGDYYDVAHPVTSEARSLIQEAVLQAYARSAASVAVSATSNGR